MTDNGMVAQFHHKFGLDNTVYGPRPGPRPPLPRELMDFRIKFLKEELKEFEDAVEEGDEAKMFDALLDLVYVAHGTAHLKGFPWLEGMIEVQRANMSKVRAERADQSERGGTWDVIKPEGFVPPDIEGVLHRHGWDSF